MLIYSFAHDKIALWLLGTAWSWGFIGVWGPLTVSDPHPRRRQRLLLGRSVRHRRGAVAVRLGLFARDDGGAFVAAFLLIPVILLVMRAINRFYGPEHARKELDAISV